MEWECEKSSITSSYFLFNNVTNVPLVYTTESHTVYTCEYRWEASTLYCSSDELYFCSQFVAITKKSRILDVVYNASNNELVRTKTLVKNCIVQIDATPFRQW